jgi:DNA polymerase-3 subunit delta
MAAAPLKPVYLIFGSDKPKVRRAVAKLRRRVVTETASEFNVSVFDASRDPAATVVATANTASFMLGTRLIVVANADAWKSAERGVITHYLNDPAPEACLCLVATSWLKTDKLHKVIERVGEVLRYDLPKRWLLAGWVQKLAAQRGCTLHRQQAQRVLDLVGGEPDLVEAEVEKLAAYVGGGEVSDDDIMAICTPGVDVAIWDLTDAVGKRQPAAAFRALETFFAAGSEASEAFYPLLRHMRNLAAVVELMPESPPAEIAKQLGVHTFTAQKLAEQRSNFDRRSLGRALVALAEAETAMRGKSTLALEPEADTDRLVLEVAVARLARLD